MPERNTTPISDQTSAAPDPGRSDSPDAFQGGEGLADTASPAEQAAALEMMLDLPLEVTVELGRARMQLGEALSLQPGAIIELNRLPGEALDMYVNDRLVARGEVVVANDVLALRVAELVGPGAAATSRR